MKSLYKLLDYRTEEDSGMWYYKACQFKIASIEDYDGQAKLIVFENKKFFNRNELGIWGKGLIAQTNNIDEGDWGYED